ncbi:MAG: SDR family NAD(P)-dependent oxidoreductase [Clostridia bacterium]|nr:SDR family NAD(P)-dependent oxidoreductase [Clostridia bacterium]MBQ6236360.1 SDR family NAD(P)-dependent oxidoreductase [Clostridia bacterium]MBR0509819.1 SDR family NAD(P)-dependent oxidoreductase [Clostridia bacterium]
MKTVVITGANSGLGFETAKKIAASKEYRVILACRNDAKAAQAKADIIAATGNDAVETLRLDTSLLSSVREFANNYIKAYGTVDVLINNAGISPMRDSGTTEEGFEVVFATNYLGHFLLTQLLLPHMAPNGRIINVSSDMHNPPGGIEWKGVGYLAHEAMIDRRRYSYSKLCAIYFTLKLDELLKKQGSSISVNSFNPGFMAATNFSGGHTDKARALVVKTTMPDRYGELGTSSDALAQIAVDSRFDGVSGQYFDRSTSIKKSSELSYSEGNRDELWNKSLEYCGLR